MAFYGGGVSRRRSSTSEHSPPPGQGSPHPVSVVPTPPNPFAAPPRPTNPFAPPPSANPLAHYGAAAHVAGPIGEGSTVLRRASVNHFARSAEGALAPPPSDQSRASTQAATVDLSTLGNTVLSEATVAGLAHRLVGNGAPLVRSTGNDVRGTDPTFP
jgi:hypothetical protein